MLAGEIPANDYSVALPEAPAACADLIEPLTADIDDFIADLKDAQDCTEYFVTSVCTDLDQQVSQLLAGSEDFIEIVPRIQALLGDILLIEGQDGEDVEVLGIRLRDEYEVDTDAPVVDSGIVRPSDEVPSKCAEQGVSYEDLNGRIDLVSDLLSFEEWLVGRLGESCGESGRQFREVIAGMQVDIDNLVIEKTNLVNTFFGDFGGDSDLLTYASDLDAAYQAAKEAGEIESNFSTVSQIVVPESPDTCFSITNPLFLQIQSNVFEITDYMDCIDFTKEHVCGELADTVTQMIADNESQLDVLAGSVFDKMNILLPSEGEGDENL